MVRLFQRGREKKEGLVHAVGDGKTKDFMINSVPSFRAVVEDGDRILG